MSKIAKVVEVAGAKSIDEVLTQSNTDWDVEVMGASVATPDGQRLVEDGGFRALVRPDNNTALAFVGERFKPNNHRAQLHTLDSMVRDGTIVPATVSVWDGGAVLAYQFRCPDLDVTIRDRDIVSPLLTLAFAYGSQLADSTFFSDFRWFCKNQLGRVAKLNSESRCKHRGGIIERFGDLLGARIKELSGELGDRYASMKRMTEKSLRGQNLMQYFAQCAGANESELMQAMVLPVKELTGPAARIPDILDCYAAEQDAGGDTVWRAYNAVTRYMTHRQGHKEETRQRRMLLGAGSDAANQAWEYAAQIAA